MSTALDARYGRTRARRLRTRGVAIVVGAGVLAVTIVWVLWVGLFGTSASIETQDAGYVIVDAHTIDVTAQVSADPGTVVHCSIEALSKKFAIVGWKVVTLPAIEERSRAVTERLRTSEPAVTGSVGSCWVG